MNPEKITIPEILNRKKTGRKIIALTAYDYTFSKIVDQVGIDLLLVGDSLAMVAMGYENTLPVTMDEMIHHTRAVKRGVSKALVVGDMPFMSYQVSNEQAVTNAGRFIKEGGASAVKLEGGIRSAERIQAITESGISVMGHIGLTPQSVHQFGGYKVQGKNDLDARQIKKDATELQKAGAFSLVLEGIPMELACEITASLGIPTIGIGAGPHCDGQILVLHDILGLNMDFVPKYVRVFDDLGSRMKKAIDAYAQSVRSGEFPDKEHSYRLRPEPSCKVPKTKVG